MTPGEVARALDPDARVARALDPDARVARALDPDARVARALDPGAPVVRALSAEASVVSSAGDSAGWPKDEQNRLPAWSSDAHEGQRIEGMPEILKCSVSGGRALLVISKAPR